jgi:NitT/TauT family transport system ATP-binding protein
MSQNFPRKPKQTNQGGVETANQAEQETAGTQPEETSATASALPDWIPPAAVEPDTMELAPVQAEPAQSAAEAATEEAQAEAEAATVAAADAADATTEFAATTAEAAAPDEHLEETAAEAGAAEAVAEEWAETELVETEPAAVAESPGEATADEAFAPVKPHIVELVKVWKWFEQARGQERFCALEGLDFKIEADEDGAFVVLLGPSGCGKSTILSLISGLSLADKGEVRVNGHLVDGPDPDAATVPQAYTCYPWRTVLENVEFGLSLQGLPKKQRRERALEYLRKVDLADRCDAYPKQLSGGMQQRVAIARTLAMQLPIVLMDEPFGALDAQTRSDMQQMVLQLWNEEKNTIIFVTHDITEALLLGDRVVVFSSRPARVIHDICNLDDQLEHERPPDVVRRPEFIALYEEIRELLKKPPTHSPSARATPARSATP